MIRPRALPKAREQTIRALTRPSPAQSFRFDNEADPGGLDRMVRHLRAAGLYWVSAAMSALSRKGLRSSGIPDIVGAVRKP